MAKNIKLDLRGNSESPGLSKGDERAVLSDRRVVIATSTAEKLVDRSFGEPGGFKDFA